MGTSKVSGYPEGQLLSFMKPAYRFYSSRCPDPTILSPFKYNPVSGVAESTLYSMFKFPDSNRVHFQCDIAVCNGPCKKVDCDEVLPEAR